MLVPIFANTRTLTIQNFFSFCNGPFGIPMTSFTNFMRKEYGFLLPEHRLFCNIGTTQPNLGSAH